MTNANEPTLSEPRHARAQVEDAAGKPLHLGCLVAAQTHHAVRAHAAGQGMTIRRLLLTALRDAGVPIPGREIEDRHR
jgi:hypothetical protein